MRTIGTFGTINEAYLAQAWLESCGLKSLIPDDITATGAMPYVAVYSGIRLQVEEGDVEKATLLLKDFELSKGPPIEQNAPPPEAVCLSRNVVKGVFIFDFLIAQLLYLYGFLADFSYSPEVVDYLGSTYLWYEGAYLCYLLFYPLMGLYAVAGLGLIFFQNWGRYLYLVLWIPAFFTMLFSSAWISYGWRNFLPGLACFSGGFVCCLIFFTPAVRYFGKFRTP